MQRLLDIVACTLAYGPASEHWQRQKEEAEKGQGQVQERGKGPGGRGVQGAARAGEKQDARATSGTPLASAVEPRETSGTERAHPETSSVDSALGVTGEGKGSGEVGGVGKGEGGKSKLGMNGNKEEIFASLKSAMARRTGEGQGAESAADAMAAAEAAAERGDHAGMMAPYSDMGHFYDFLSAAHLPAPLQSVRRFTGQDSPPLPNGHAGDTPLALLEVKLCTGKWATVAALRSGFLVLSCPGKAASIHDPTLVGALRQASRPFAKVPPPLLHAHAAHPSVPLRAVAASSVTLMMNLLGFT